jgi:hypothetical protein
MRNFLTTTALASAFTLAALAASPMVRAQDNQPGGGQDCIGEQCPGQGGGQKQFRKMPDANQMDDQSGDQVMPRKKRMSNQPDVDQDQSGDQAVPRKRRLSNQPDVDQDQSGDQAVPRKKRVGSQQQDDDVDVNVRARVQAGEGKWRFDSSRHQRRRSKDATFRFYFGGYWYPEPYWEVYSVRPRYRVSCGEGREIVAERFNRVRVVECNGGTYTYLGRSQGDTYRVLVNARTGRIVGRALI